MSTLPQYVPHYTIDDYQLWEGDWELWNGIPVAMTPSAFGPHSRLSAQLAKVLGNAIDDADCDATVLIEIDWIVADDTILRPDLTIVCGSAPKRHVENAPALVVEVLSASTRERDLTFKRRFYQQESVCWYLIVDPETANIQALKLDANGEYQPVVHDKALAIEICKDCSLTVRVDRLFQ